MTRLLKSEPMLMCLPQELSKQQYEAGFSANSKAEKGRKADKDADKVRALLIIARPRLSTQKKKKKHLT